MKKITLISISLLLLSSCGMNWGYLPNYHHTEVVLDEANYTYVGSATGESSAINIFGIGPIGSQSLVQDAKADLLSQVDLYSGSRAIVNMVVDEKQSYFTLFYVKRTVYVSADIIEFKEVAVNE